MESYKACRRLDSWADLSAFLTIKLLPYRSTSAAPTVLQTAVTGRAGRKAAGEKEEAVRRYHSVCLCAYCAHDCT